ncbi:hypothetical protein HNQ51_001729 [Inhella inkyongensis]|uniref:Uncharacterized protein n=1 Tax=Inhella inkyongensis TaxID=392593 RepID=A0A840S284_9BURK|nr:hypothetical protein [Inhella inkyongensis]MBB5204415.1 hypothetical protein [Inhella inkyongensis]
MTEADSAAAAELAIQVNLSVPDHLAPDVVAMGLLTYLTALAATATREQRRRMAVMACNAAAELAETVLPGRTPPTANPGA